MNKGSKEIEMQTYSMSYSYPVTYPTALPYHWDGECHLTLNQSFYAPPPEDSALDLPDQLFSDEEKEELAKPVNPSPLLISPMNCEEPEPQRAESIVSIGSLSTEGPSSLNSKAGGIDTIDQQLDFILESIKKQKKPVAKKPPKDKKRKLTRKRKTNAQLEMLQKEVGENEMLDKEKMKALAEKTGLKVGQVYKWYWDYKRKQGSQTESEC